MIDPESVFDFCIQLAQCHVQCFLAAWTVPVDLPYFEGHFPGHPVLPAVAIIDATTVFLKKALSAKDLKIESVKAAKFTGLVTPGAEITIAAHKIKEGNEWLTEWRDSERLLSSVTLLIG